MSEDDWEPNLESEEEPPSDDESRGQSDGAGSSMGSDGSENERWSRQEANRIGTQGPTTCGWL